MEKPKCSLVPVSPMQAPAAPAAIDDGFIKSRIHTIRGIQVMLSPDLADLYQVETRAFNQAVKRNEDRFPPSFRFQLTKEELREVITNCDNPDRLRFSPQTPYAFTEQGVAMLSGILNSAVAIRVSIRIMETFVAMRKALASIAPVMARLAEAERRQLEDRTRQIADQTRNEARFETIFKAMDGGDFPPQKIFFDGQLWDARAFVDRLVKSARKSLLLVDNWATVETLEMLAAKQKGVAVTVVTSEHRDRKGNPSPKILPADVAKFNAQYPKLSVRFRENFHDRFLVVDDRELYLIGASLKDLGKKCFGFTRMDPAEIPGLKTRM